jgi:hypothetical protein
MNYDHLTDKELLRLLSMQHPLDPLVRALAERLEMRLRDIEDLKIEVRDWRDSWVK